MSTAILSIQSVSKAFGSIVALVGVDLEVGPGEAVAIIGPNGSGKSTLLNVIGRTVDVDSGGVSLNGTSVLLKRPSELAALGLGRVFQIPSPPGAAPVVERLALGGFAHASLATKLTPRWQCKEVARAPKRCNIIARLGLSSVLTTPLRELTYAQRRYVDLACASAVARSALVLDEPTAGLTRAERKPVIDVLQELKSAGVALLIVEHDLGFIAELADRCMLLEGGHVLRVSPTQDLLKSPELSRVYLGTVKSDGRA